MNLPATDIALIEFKGTTLPVLAITLRSLEPQALANASNALFGDGAFFDGDLAVLDLSQISTYPQPIDWPLIVQILGGHGLRVLGVARCSPELAGSALAAGLPTLALNVRGVKPAAPSPKAEPVAASTDFQLESQSAAAPDSDSAPAETAMPAEANPLELVAEKLILQPASLIVDRPLRSGQQVYAKGGDLVMLAAVNPGAEVIADGNIHVYAPLRGKAIAGAKGNAAARIFAQCLEPELVAIAGTYRTTENPLPPEVVGKAAQVRLDGERLVFEAVKL